MDEAFEVLLVMFDNAPLIVAAVVGVVALIVGGPLAFGYLRANKDIARRVSGDAVALAGGAGAFDPGATRRAKAFSAITDYFQNDLAKRNAGELKVLRKQLIQAGFFDVKAPAWFFAARVILAALFGVAAPFVTPFAYPEATLSIVALSAVMAAITGYVFPTFYLSKRIQRRQSDIRSGFPDFMDLMVVCSEAGLSIEAAIDRVSGELQQSCPALADNLYLTSLEVRAGRTMSAGVAQFAERIGMDEARSLATLLQQSEELGTSLSQSLQIYSDDMRHKRLMKAEEKAYALPVKLTIPLILFVFPVLIVTILLPIFARLYG